MSRDLKGHECSSNQFPHRKRQNSSSSRRRFSWNIQIGSWWLAGNSFGGLAKNDTFTSILPGTMDRLCLWTMCRQHFKHYCRSVTVVTRVLRGLKFFVRSRPAKLKPAPYPREFEKFCPFSPRTRGLLTSGVTDGGQGVSRLPWQAKCKTTPLLADIFGILLVFSRLLFFAFLGLFSFF